MSPAWGPTRRSAALSLYILIAIYFAIFAWFLAQKDNDISAIYASTVTPPATVNLVASNRKMFPLSCMDAAIVCNVSCRDMGALCRDMCAPPLPARGPGVCVCP